MINAIGFDADDTLWHSETIFEDYHRRFQAKLARYHDPKTVEQALYATEMRNLDLFGYGVKSFALSSIETAIDLTNGTIPAEELRALIQGAKDMLAHPVELLEGAAETIAAFNRRGWYVFVVTNQSGIARNYYTEADMHTLHDWMQAELARAGAHVDRIYYCPYHAEGENPAYRKDSFDCKPKPGMLLRAAREWRIDLAGSFFIGDSTTDVLAGQRAGVQSILLTHCGNGGRDGRCDAVPDHEARDIGEAVAWALGAYLHPSQPVQQ